jgi:hypothetical protein
MSTIVTVGHTVNMAIKFLDQNGNPMLTPPAPSAPPAWNQSAPQLATPTIAADGLTASILAVAAGMDTVNVSAVVGGQTFTASLAVEIDAAPQVLTSIAIDATVV